MKGYYLRKSTSICRHPLEKGNPSKCNSSVSDNNWFGICVSLARKKKDNVCKTSGKNDDFTERWENPEENVTKETPGKLWRNHPRSFRQKKRHWSDKRGDQGGFMKFRWWDKIKGMSNSVIENWKRVLQSGKSIRLFSI